LSNFGVYVLIIRAITDNLVHETSALERVGWRFTSVRRSRVFKGKFQVKYVLNGAALSCVAALACASGAISSSFAAGVPGWPTYVAMGAVGGPDDATPTKTSTGGNDDFGGKPVDVVFKYAGSAGTGDPGMIDPPTNSLRMTGDLTALSTINTHAMRVAIVEYTAQMSGGYSLADFSNTSTPDPASGGTYLMARHLISLASDAIAMNDKPVTYGKTSYYGTLILNPDLLGSIQQGNYILNVRTALPANKVNTAVDQALCLLTTQRTYYNTSNPNGLSSPPYLGKTYKGTAVSILEQLLADGYPVWSMDSPQDPYWNTATDNLMNGPGSSYSQVGTWFNQCVANPTYNKTTYKRPDFPQYFDGWVQANNWLIRTFSPKGHVTFGWQDNMWAVGSGYWLHASLSNTQIYDKYSLLVSNWLTAHAPSAITTGALGASYIPDYFVFDRYESDDSAGAGEATLYNARSWDNYLEAIGLVSAKFNKIPLMMWQIPGSHLPYVGEKQPELLANTPGQYIFSTAPVYFFGEPYLKANLSNLIAEPTSSINSAVGDYVMDCSTTAYNCAAGSDYAEYLLAYQGKADNYNWGSGNGKLAKAAADGVFAILWGGGNTTSVIHNFSNPDDHGWLASKILSYYAKPTPLTIH
jgi:hypothetical protein